MDERNNPYTNPGPPEEPTGIYTTGEKEKKRVAIVPKHAAAMLVLSTMVGSGMVPPYTLKHESAWEPVRKLGKGPRHQGTREKARRRRQGA